MDKKKIVELVILGILGIFFIITLMNTFKPKKRRPTPAPKATKEKSELTPGTTVGKQLPYLKTDISKLLEEQKKREQAEWGIDPFYHGVKGEVTQGSLVLKGITMGKGRKNYAFINDQIVTVGDTVSGYKVIEVQKNKVLLKKGEESFYLALPEE